MPQPDVRPSSTRWDIRQGRTVEVVFRSASGHANVEVLTPAEAHQLQRKLVQHLDILRRENLEATTHD